MHHGRPHLGHQGVLAAVLAKDLAVGARHHAIEAGEQGIGAVQRGHDLFCIGFAAHQHTQRAARPVQPRGQFLHLPQAGAQGGVLGGEGIEIAQQFTR